MISTQSMFNKMSSIVISATMIAMTFSPVVASADADPSSSYTITGAYTVVGQTINLNGTSAGDPQSAADGTQHMAVDWDEDQNASTTVWVTDSNASGPAFTPVFSDCYGHSRCFVDSNWTATHDYASFGSGTYHVKAIVYHGSTSGNDGSDLSTISFSIVVPPPVNHAPVANAQSTSTNEDTATTVTLVATDIDGNSLTYSIVGNPTHGTLGTVTGNQVVYTPNANYNGSDSFTFKANDGSLDSTPATVSITVNPINDAPVLAAIADQSIDELATLTVNTSASDVDVDTLSYSITSGAQGGMNIDSSGVFTWTPTEAQGVGTYPVTITVSDGNGGTNAKSFTITVNEVNVAPVATDQTTSTHVNTSKIITLASSDVDLPAQTLIITVVTPPTHGTLNVTTGSPVTYTPETDYTGIDSFTYKVNDGVIDGNTATISITINNGAPTLAEIANQVVNELATLAFSLVGADPDTDTLTYSISGLPTGATIDSSTGAFSWTPTEAQGPLVYNLTASVTDGLVTTSQPFTVTVNEVNDAPVAVEQSITTAEDTAFTGTVIGTDSDIPAQALTYTVVNAPMYGVLVLDTAGGFTYTPNANYNGSDSFTFKANDGVIDGNTATVSVTVTPVNDAPTIELVGANPLNFVIGGTFTDPGATSTDLENGSLTPVVTGTVDTGTPGTYTLTYTATDFDGASVSITRTVVVTAAPVENTAELCSDKIDNDGDEAVDLADSDCSQFVPAPVENTAPLCSDGIDNDHDELVDLADPDCAAFVPAPQTPPAPPSGGGGGGGGNGPIAGSFGVVAGGGLVLGASTSTVGSAGLPAGCTALINTYLRQGKKSNNTADVLALQKFLNEQLKLNIPLTGYFGPQTNQAVRQFQAAHPTEVLTPWNLNAPTGFVYKTTKRWINLMNCASLNIPMPTDLTPYQGE